MQQRARGMTLIELMVVVAIIGVLAAVAVFTYSRYIKKARVSEVHAVMSEFRLKEEEFYTENGTFLATGTGESDIFPAGVAADNAVSAAGPPAEWGQLRINTGKNALWCGYVAIAGAANDATNIGPLAAGAGFTAPTTDWFYVVADCPFNSRQYLITSTTDRVVEL